MSVNSSEFLSFENQIRVWKQRQWKFQGVSFLVHSLVILALYLMVGAVDKIIEEKIESDVDLGSVINVEPIGMVAPLKVIPVYDNSSDILIKLPIQRPAVPTKSQVLGGLLSQLRGTRAQVSTQEIQSDLEKPSQGGSLETQMKAVALKTGQALTKEQMWNQLRYSRREVKKKVSVDGASLMNPISKNYYRFQNCYERALLVDKDLSVNTTVTVSLQGSGTFDRGTVSFKGPGSNASKSKLQGCILKEVRGISFPRNGEEVSFKFNLIFRS